jgi:hypothetical protein
LRGGEVLLELHAAHLLLAHALRGARVGARHEAGAAKSEHAKPWPAGRPHE